MIYGAYVHVPWCRVRCPYCAFYVVPERGAPVWGPFVDRVLAERALRSTEFPGAPATVYLGGGTPSRLLPEALARLIEGLAPVPGAEITAEANPEDVDADWLAGAIDAGVNRLSLGVQSFDPSTAGRLGRAHTSAEAGETVRLLARSALRSWSVDLIFAVPGQTLADLDVELDRIVDAGAPHVSIYGLTFEPGTKFERARARGRLVPVDDEAWRQMYDRIVERLEGAGLARYEVSNFGRVGHRSAHNRIYWTDQPYLGLGPSAHGYAPNGDRWANVADLARYLGSEDPTDSRETPDPDARAADLLVSCLRAAEGVDLAHLARRTGLAPSRQVTDALLGAGLVTASGTRLALTRQGYPVCDGVVGRLIESLRPQQNSGSTVPRAGGRS